MPASTPSLRLLADQTADVLAGFAAVFEGLAVLVGDPARPRSRRGRMRLYVPDWLPSLINGGRAFVTIGAVELFWVATAWPNGGSAIVFVAIVILLLSPRAEQAYAGALAFALGTTIAIPIAATIKFAVLPALETFPAFCLAMGAFLIPVGAAMVQSQNPARCRRMYRPGFQLYTSPSAHQRNDLRHGAILQLRAWDLRGLRRSAALVSPAAAPHSGIADRAVACIDVARSAPACDRSTPIERRGLAGPHLQPARGIARPGRAFAAGAASIGAFGRDRNHPPSSRHIRIWPGTGARLGAAGARPKK